MASASHELATPANWNHSEDCIIVSTVSTD
ncbi:MAG: hypothetical protein HRU13_01585 [Phycisphaerales bacterium]|nr:hypothetical protein [Phycisphaerales bacterium]